MGKYPIEPETERSIYQAPPPDLTLTEEILESLAHAEKYGADLMTDQYEENEYTRLIQRARRMIHAAFASQYFASRGAGDMETI